MIGAGQAKINSKIDGLRVDLLIPEHSVCIILTPFEVGKHNGITENGYFVIYVEDSADVLNGITLRSVLQIISKKD